MRWLFAFRPFREVATTTDRAEALTLPRGMLGHMTVELRRAPHAGWRALAASVLVMAGASGAHTWAGGHLPSLAGLVLLGGVVLAASWLLLRGTVSSKLLLPAVAAGQGLLHTSFVELSGHAGHGGTAVETTWSSQMLLAHLGVTLLTALAWWLCHRAALTVVRVLQLALAHVTTTPRRAPSHDLALPSPVRALLHTAPRRGPPALAGRA